MMLSVAVTLVILSLLGAGWLYVRNTVMDNPYFSLTVRIEDLFPEATKSDLEQILSTSLSPAGDTSHFDLYEGSSTDLIETVELRISRSDPRQKFLVIAFKQPTHITPKDIPVYFGLALPMEVSSPHGPDAGSYFLTSKRHWGQLRFGFSREDDFKRVTFDTMP